MKWLLCLVLVAFACGARAAESGPPGVRDTVNRLIAYEVGGEGSVRDETFLAFFTPRFRAAIEAQNAQTDIQTIDSDFICQCQTAVLKMHILQITGSKDAAVAGLESWAKGARPVRVTLRLERGDDDNTWFISDVQTPRTPSLLAEMEQAAKPPG